MIDDWWNQACGFGGCITAFLQGDIVIWPVWRNPQDPLYWTIKVHHLKRNKWERISGHMCAVHNALAVQSWEVDTEADVQWMERTDAWAAKNGGNI